MTSSRARTESTNVNPCVLLVEDQFLIGSMIALELRDLGFEVLGPAITLQEAKNLAQSRRLSAAVLNHELEEGTTEQLARVLIQEGCPVLFISARDPEIAPDDLKDCPWLRKPFSHEELALAVRQLFASDDKCTCGDCHACYEI